MEDDDAEEINTRRFFDESVMDDEDDFVNSDIDLSTDETVTLEIRGGGVVSW